MSSEDDVTPYSWLEVELGELVTVNYGKALSAENRSSTGRVPVIGSSGVVGHHDKALVDGPCLVVGRKGAAGSVHLVREPNWPIDTAYFIQPPNGINLVYLSYLLSSKQLGQLDKSTAIPSLSRDDLYRVVIPLASDCEQTRIVEKLEELLSDLDAGVAELKAAQKKLALYRQSLLKAAVEGALTAEWRAKRTPSPQPLPREGGGAYSWGEEERRRLLNDPQDSSRSPCGEETEAWSRSQEAPLSPCGRGVGGEGAEGAERVRNTATPQTLNHAKLLRRHQTPQEQALWQTLRAKRFDGYKFRRQQPMGTYIVDFVCFSHRLIIELDGGHHAETVDYDTQRDNWLREQGFQVLRFWNHDYTSQPEAVLEAIWQALQNKTPLPNPSPARGEGLQIETGAQLLERILIERRARWEAKQLAKFNEQGKTPPQDWQKKYPEPVQPDTTHLPELPQGWVWASLSQVGWLDRGRSKHRPRNAAHLYGGPYPFVQTGDIRYADTFISNVEATYSEEGLAQSRLWPVGTMCITIAANIGKTSILSIDACFPDSVVGFLPGSHEVSVRYIEYFMRSIQQKLEDEAPATAQKNINLEILGKIVIPIPPIQEQNQIIEILDTTFGVADENDRAIENTLKQTTAQRQNLLRAAFSGQLVPQDPNDEPASVLLERIRAERAAQEAAKTARSRKVRKS